MTNSIMKQMKEVEDFLNSEYYREQLFGTKEPRLELEFERKFGNPHEFDEDTLEEIRQDYIEVEEVRVDKPEDAKKYTPRKSTIKNLGERGKWNPLRYSISKHLRTISPFPIHYNSVEPMTEKIYRMKGTARKVLESIISFNCEELCGMEPDTKREVIEAIMTSIQYAFREKRNEFFYKGFMFESDYEEGKLKYLFENGEEPVVIPDSSYEFLEKLYLQAMRKNIDSLFQEAYVKKKGVAGFEEMDGDEFFVFMVECAKHFDYLHSRVIDSLYLHYTMEVLYAPDLKETEVQTYHSLKKCPIKESISSNRSNNKAYDWISSLQEVFCIEPNRLFRLLSADNYQYIIYEGFLYLKTSLTISSSGDNTDIIHQLGEDIVYFMKNPSQIRTTKENDKKLFAQLYYHAKFLHENL